MNTGILILAAGLSKRLGKPKQLLVYKGQSLLQKAVATALSTSAQTVVVVLGARAEEIKKSLEKSPVQVVVNDEWKEGMAASIRCGVEALLSLSPGVEGLILMVCDQPFVTTSLLSDLIATHHHTGKSLVACRYAGTFGPPVFFHRSFFPHLLKLEGDVGARRVIKQHPGDAELIEFPKGVIDIDTDFDYQTLTETDHRRGEEAPS